MLGKNVGGTFLSCLFLGNHTVEAILKRVSMRYCLGLLLYLSILLVSANTGGVKYVSHKLICEKSGKNEASYFACSC